jgi:DNA-binding SARP family transcriptional activator
MFEIGLLGPMRVTKNRVSHTLPGAKLRTLLAVLALHAAEPVTSDQLIEELGLVTSTSNASNTLHAHIMRLRNWLGERFSQRDALLTREDGYVLVIDRASVDAHRFMAAAQHAAALAPGRSAAAVTTLEPALRLWRGPALRDAGDGPICRRAANALTMHHIAAQELMVEARIAAGQNALAIIEIEYLIADHPFRERLWEQLMLALYRCGRQAEAVRSYHHVRGLLATELGLEPGPGLRGRFQEILNHEPGVLQSRTDAAALPASGWADPVY